jgi:hypothetical protein
MRLRGKAAGCAKPRHPPRRPTARPGGRAAPLDWWRLVALAGLGRVATVVRRAPGPTPSDWFRAVRRPSFTLSVDNAEASARHAGRCPYFRALRGTPPGAPAALVQLVARAAATIRPVTAPGRETIDRCEALTLTTRAPARSAMNSCAAGGSRGRRSRPAPRTECRPRPVGRTAGRGRRSRRAAHPRLPGRGGGSGWQPRQPEPHQTLRSSKLSLNRVERSMPSAHPRRSWHPGLSLEPALQASGTGHAVLPCCPCRSPRVGRPAGALRSRRVVAGGMTGVPPGTDRPVGRATAGGRSRPTGPGSPRRARRRATRPRLTVTWFLVVGGQRGRADLLPGRPLVAHQPDQHGPRRPLHPPPGRRPASGWRPRRGAARRPTRPARP